jgi:hypothetical protein
MVAGFAAMSETKTKWRGGELAKERRDGREVQFGSRVFGRDAAVVVAAQT